MTCHAHATHSQKRARLQRALDVHDDAARRAYLQKTRLLDRINAVAYADGSDGSGDERDGADDVDANERASDTASTTTSEILSWLPTDHPLRARLPGGVQDARAWIEERLDVHYRMLPAMAGAQLLPPVASSGRRGGGATTSISGPSVSTHGNILRIRAVFGSAAAATADRASSSMSTSSAHMDDTTGATATASGSTQRYSRKTPDHRIRKHKPIPPPQADGTFTVPAKYGPVTVVKLGAIAAAMNEIEDVGGYDTERYIYPVGYTTTRRFLSTLNAGMDGCACCE